MPHHFHAEQWLPYPLEPLFTFFANPHNLPRLSPPAQQLRIEEAIFAVPPPREQPARGIIAGPESRITISFRPIPNLFVRIPWELEIIDFEWFHFFTDKQIRGPFASWQHTHTFTTETRTTPEGPEKEGTLLTDDIAYALPAAPISNPLQPTVHRKLQALFQFRHHQLEALLQKHVKPTNTLSS